MEFLEHLGQECKPDLVVDYITGLVVEEPVDSDRLVESREGCSLELWVCDGGGGGGGGGGGEVEFLVHLVEELEEIDGVALMVVDYVSGLGVEEAVDIDRPELVVEESEEDDGLALMVVAYRPGLVADELLVYLAEECTPELVVESRSEMAVHRREAKVYEKAVDGSSDADAKLAI
ncbi:hypothetical protein SASPL_119428 [Salvia splendens]|uniref:Uncharacterized protein n=1 Tax=Salvia splendens TaxID=180675 RepID=A0A8X8XQJ3_SALSN|nr:hypothetical protein SASPL_119428 [Salvia splendens]